MYQMNSPGMWGSVFAVPTEIVDKHIRMCGPLSLKVLMILLRHGRPFSPEELASMLGQSVPDTQDALNYWVDVGVIARDGEAPSPLPQAQPEPAVEVVSPPPAPAAVQALPPAEEKGKLVKMGRSRSRLNSREIAEMSREDGNIKAILSEAQSAFHRPLKPIETEAIATLYCYDGVPPDIILMLLHYCISIDKASMGYLEKVAADWMERGIDTHEKAEKELLRLTEVSQTESAVRAAFGIYGRKITERELAFFEVWQGEMGFSVQMIQLAYDKTIESKGKLSFPYINGILSDWHKKGITTPEKASVEKGGKAGSPAQAGREPQASYDLDKFDRVILQGSVLDD